jgi:serine/threonine-protein kinase
LLGINGSVKLTDFGLARARDRAVSLTAPGPVKGKISYLSPEVAWGKRATPLSDIFTMGVVMWEILAGRKLFDGKSDLETFARIRNADVSPLADERSDLPPALVEAVHKATAKEAKDRFRSARAMSMALSECLRSQEMSMDIQTLLGTSVAQAREALGYTEPSESAVTNQIDTAFSLDIDLNSQKLNGPAAIQSAETQVGVIGESSPELSSVSEIVDVDDD